MRGKYKGMMNMDVYTLVVEDCDALNKTHKL